MSEQAVLTVDGLPSDALGAASAFHAAWTAQVGQHVAGGAAAVAVVLPKAGVDHADWRRAAARDLARAYAPARVNVIVAGGDMALQATLTYLRDAPSVTGHYLVLHDD